METDKAGNIQSDKMTQGQLGKTPRATDRADVLVRSDFPEGLVVPAPAPSALVIVADSDLADALATGLQAYGLTCDICRDLASISPEALRDRHALLVDVTLLSVKPQRYVRYLRAGGWTGLTVLLAEDCKSNQTQFEPAETVAVLVKPFGSPQLLEIAQRLGIAP